MKVVFPGSLDFAARLQAGQIVSGADADAEKHAIEADKDKELPKDQEDNHADETS